MDENILSIHTKEGFQTINFDKLVRAKYVEEDEGHSMHPSKLMLEFENKEPITLREKEAESVAYLLDKYSLGEAYDKELVEGDNDE